MRLGVPVPAVGTLATWGGLLGVAYTGLSSGSGVLAVSDFDAQQARLND